MKTIKTFAAVIALSVLPLTSFAQSVTATDSTLDSGRTERAITAAKVLMVFMVNSLVDV